MAKMEISPVALFVFNRPHLTLKVYEQIRAARPKRFLVVADGPRVKHRDDAELCRATRKIVSSPDWPCELLTNFADKNLGCKGRMSSGLDWVFQQCTEAIILEDDCVPCASFFSFCTDMLDRYREDTRIMHVSGDNYQRDIQRCSASYLFSRYTLSWGWATWKRAWRHYDVNVSMWPKAYRERWLQSILDDPTEIQHWEATFDSLYRGQIDTWDYQWLFTCWWYGGLSILPGQNLVTNIGMGADATHFREEGHSTLGVPTRELGGYVHAPTVIRDEKTDRFIFEEHIAPRQAATAKGLGEMFRNRLALRSRIRRLLPRSLRYFTAS
jgi:hypothetical protein